jgi:hypothetical protein
MFQWIYIYVARVYLKCFICFKRILFIWMWQLLYTCCKHMFINISPVSDVCYRSALCCNSSRCRKRTHVEAVPTGVVVPTCATSEEGVGVPHACASMRMCTACRRCGMWGRACRHNSCMRGIGVIPFLHEWSALILHGSSACSGKIAATPAATRRDRAILTHERLRDS